ncbi:hypothetical protein N7492_004238 [Penicillium capsulatum]|uniref:Uncharacterized protein n=1 Tax=Penicillium capsulatum TaxID=69766 RepID=A0A9W9I7G2_9EURO|nr:hypothetical protein N7492_004238 [Penicillium capsulatum]KAJ6136643.1 hypothetical protein N7512_001803 [Penicillium capsulatum]
MPPAAQESGQSVGSTDRPQSAFLSPPQPLEEIPKPRRQQALQQSGSPLSAPEEMKMGAFSKESGVETGIPKSRTIGESECTLHTTDIQLPIGRHNETSRANAEPSALTHNQLSANSIRDIEGTLESGSSSSARPSKMGGDRSARFDLYTSAPGLLLDGKAGEAIDDIIPIGLTGDSMPKSKKRRAEVIDLTDDHPRQQSGSKVGRIKGSPACLATRYLLNQNIGHQWNETHKHEYVDVLRVDFDYDNGKEYNIATARRKIKANTRGQTTDSSMTEELATRRKFTPASEHSGTDLPRNHVMSDGDISPIAPDPDTFILPTSHQSTDKSDVESKATAGRPQMSNMSKKWQSSIPRTKIVPPIIAYSKIPRPRHGLQEAEVHNEAFKSVMKNSRGGILKRQNAGLRKNNRPV